MQVKFNIVLMEVLAELTENIGRKKENVDSTNAKPCFCCIYIGGPEESILNIFVISEFWQRCYNHVLGVHWASSGVSLSGVVCNLHFPQILAKVASLSSP
jgi:hypothetical protein